MLFDEVLFSYQQEAVETMAGRRVCLLADQPGLGKTLEVLGSFERLGLLDDPNVWILIVAPIVAVQSAWIDSINRFVVPRYGVEVLDLSFGSSVQKQKALDIFISEPVSGASIVVANYGVVEWLKSGARVPALFDIKFDAIVIDESHTVLPILNDRSLTNFWKGLARFSEVPVRFAVSGTPDRGKLENRFGTYKFLFPKRFKGVSRWNWLEQNFHVFEQKVSRSRTVKQVGVLKSKDAWGFTEDEVIVRRTKLEVLKDLPAKQYNFVEVELGDKQRKDYFDALFACVEEQEQAVEDDRQTASAMVFALRARQIADCQWLDGAPVVGGESAKLAWLLEWLSERDAESLKVVVSSQFVQVLNWLRKELSVAGFSVDVIDGSKSGVERARVQNDFQNGSLQVVLLSGRMGVGITLDAADDLIMFDQPYDPDMIEQIEDRVHRASRNHQVVIWNLIAAGTMDQLVALRVSSRYKVTRELLDGRRGVEFQKKVLDKIRVPKDRGEGK